MSRRTPVKRWYRIPRNYRVADEVYVYATSAKDAQFQHWEGYGGIDSMFSDESAAFATDFDLYIDHRDEIAPIHMGRIRRVEQLDVPAWMIAAAVRIKAVPADPDTLARVDAWNHSRGEPEDRPLRAFGTEAA